MYETFRQLLDATIASSQHDPAALWESMEDTLAKRLCSELMGAMLAAGIWRGLDEESLADIVYLGETHPTFMQETISDARDRLLSKNALTADLKEACEHVLDFSIHRQEKLESRRAEHKDCPEYAEVDKLMRKLRAYGFGC